MGLFSSIGKGIVEGLAGTIKSRGDTQKARRFIRRRLIAPNISELDREEVAEKVANDIIDYMFIPGNSSKSSIMDALTWFLLDKTVLVAKRRLIKEMLLRNAADIQTYTEVVRDRDDLTWKVTKGRGDLEEFIKSLLTIIGG